MLKLPTFHEKGVVTHCCGAAVPTRTQARLVVETGAYYGDIGGDIGRKTAGESTQQSEHSASGRGSAGFPPPPESSGPGLRHTLADACLSVPPSSGLPDLIHNS